MIAIFDLMAMNADIADTCFGIFCNAKSSCQITCAVLFMMQARRKNPQIYLVADRNILFNGKETIFFA
ncbi:hypothetical protein SDC9_204057 [bioreactor metagenome]|uniref:Uncharacterized protein n=1 Tax=bioreactor metagenome TaxID=1076179 RepID=A0A645J0Y1_9ZZZZ